MQRDEKKNENTSLNDGVCACACVGYGTSAREVSQNTPQSSGTGFFDKVWSFFGGGSATGNQPSRADDQKRNDERPEGGCRTF